MGVEMHVGDCGRRSGEWCVMYDPIEIGSRCGIYTFIEGSVGIMNN